MNVEMTAEMNVEMEAVMDTPDRRAAGVNATTAPTTPTTPTAPTHHVLCDGGLCNRLNALIFALILQRQFGHRWSISWPQNNWCGAPFHSLFKTALPVDETGIEQYKLQESQHLMLMHENQVGFAAERLVINRGLNSYADYQRFLDSGHSVVYFNSLLPPFVQPAEVQDALQLLGVNDSVAALAGGFIHQHGVNAQTVGLHIRKTDFGNAVDDEALYQQAKLSPRRFFVCSDDAAVNTRFAALPNCAVFEKNAFPEKLQSEAGWQHWTTDAEGRRFPFNINRSGAAVVEGLVDLLILSQTEIVPTSHSTFLATARLFRQCGFFKPEAAVPVAQAALAVPAAPELPVTQNELLEVLNLIRPWQMGNQTKQRFGANAHGGYVLPASVQHSNTVLAIGTADGGHFEQHMAERGARVLQFDEQAEASPRPAPGLEFRRKAWASSPVGEQPDTLDLAAMNRLIDWTRARHAVLKIDTGAKAWAQLLATPSEELDRFEVIVAAFHDFDQLAQRQPLDRAVAVFQLLARTHRVVHLHANNAGGMVMLGGLACPRRIELTFMRRSAATFHGHANEPIPGPLDRPNLPQLPDLYLRAF